MSLIRRPAHRRSIRGAVAVAASAVVALSGCGVGDDTLRPGLAAQVGDTDIALEQVDDAAADLCEMVTSLTEQGASSTLPGSVVRDNSLQYAVMREIAEQLADEHDVQPGELYRSSLEGNETQLAELEVDTELLDGVVPVITSDYYFIDIVQQIGREELGLTPEEDTGNEGIEEGLRVAQEWEADHDIEVNPRFADISIGDLESILDTQVDYLSVPVSDFAKQALADDALDDPDTTYADSLPESQRCG